MVSADNAHAVHPNHPEKYDDQNRTFMNGGVVIKHNANQKYTTDAVSDAIFAEICAKAGVPVQHFANRSDILGGSTLGNLSNAHLSMNTVDIGLAQLAMHSSYETAGLRGCFVYDSRTESILSDEYRDRSGRHVSAALILFLLALSAFFVLLPSIRARGYPTERKRQQQNQRDAQRDDESHNHLFHPLVLSYPENTPSVACQSAEGVFFAHRHSYIVWQAPAETQAGANSHF